MTRSPRSKSKKNKMLGRADFIKTFKRELVPVPALGGSVFIDELTSFQVMEFNERINKMKLKGKKDVSLSTSGELMALLVSMSASDEYGDLLFTEADAKALMRNDPETLLILSNKVLEVSGMNNAAVDEVRSQLKKTKIVSSVSD